MLWSCMCAMCVRVLGVPTCLACAGLVCRSASITGGRLIRCAGVVVHVSRMCWSRVVLLVWQLAVLRYDDCREVDQRRRICMSWMAGLRVEIACGDCVWILRVEISCEDFVFAKTVMCGALVFACVVSASVARPNQTACAVDPTNLYKIMPVWFVSYQWRTCQYVCYCIAVQE